MGIIQFFKDLIGPRQPCELCRLECEQWEARRSAAADWKIYGHGLDGELFICGPCRALLLETKAHQKNPALVLGLLVRAGYARRPDTRQMLTHPKWKEIWRHTLRQGGTTTASVEETISLVDSIFDDLADRDLSGRSSGAGDDPLTLLYDAAKRTAG